MNSTAYPADNLETSIPDKRSLYVPDTVPKMSNDFSFPVKQF